MDWKKMLNEAGKNASNWEDGQTDGWVGNAIWV